MQQRMALLAPPAPRTQAPKIREPEPLDGTRSKYKSYITQLHLVFNSDPTRYSTEPSKVAYAASYLAGSAKDWFQPHINSETGVINFPSFTNFVQSIQAAFDDPDARATAERKLKALKQGPKDCSTYHAEFTTLVTLLGWDDPMKISYFQQGWSYEVQKGLAYHASPPEIFNDFVQLSIKIDNRLRALGKGPKE